MVTELTSQFKVSSSGQEDKPQLLGTAIGKTNKIDQSQLSLSRAVSAAAQTIDDIVSLKIVLKGKTAVILKCIVHGLERCLSGQG